MDILSRLFRKEPEVKDPVDTPHDYVQQVVEIDGAISDMRRARFTMRSTTHKHFDGFGAPLHTWVEKRIQAIEATCTECGVVELHSDHAGRLKGAKAGSDFGGAKIGQGTNPRLAKLVVTPKGRRRGSPPEIAKRNAEWKAYYESGQSVAAISTLYEVPETRVRDGLRVIGTKMTHRSHPRQQGNSDADRAAEMLRLRAEEFWTYEQIGEKYGVSRERVRQILVATGVDTKELLHRKSLATGAAYQPRTCAICGNPLPLRAELDAGTGESWSSHVNRLHHRLMNLGKRSTPEENAKRAAIVVDYLAGMREKDIRAKYGVTATTVTYALLQSGLTRNRSDRPKRMATLAESRARAALMVADVRSGMTQTAVARKYGVSDSRVSQAIKKAQP
jgi:transposase